MTPRTATRPLAVTPGNGASPASTRELVQTQNAILKSNDSLLGAVNQFREDLTERIGRVATQLDGVCAEVTTIKGERREEAAVARERNKNAGDERKRAAADETKHAATAMEERHDMAASEERHALSNRWRVGIAIAIGIPVFAQLWPITLAVIARIPQ